MELKQSFLKGGRAGKISEKSVKLGMIDLAQYHLYEANRLLLRLKKECYRIGSVRSFTRKG